MAAQGGAGGEGGAGGAEHPATSAAKRAKQALANAVARSPTDVLISSIRNAASNANTAAANALMAEREKRHDNATAAARRAYRSANNAEVFRDIVFTTARAKEYNQARTRACLLYTSDAADE